MNRNKTRPSFNIVYVLLVTFGLAYAYSYFVDDSLLSKVKVNITLDEKNESTPTLKPPESNKEKTRVTIESNINKPRSRIDRNNEKPRVPAYHYTKLASNNDLIFGKDSIHLPKALFSHEAMQEKLVEMAEAGNPEAQFRLGSSYSSGNRIHQDIKKALSLLKSSATQGHNLAMGKIGYIYATGLGGITSDKEEAAKWYFKQQIFAPDEDYRMFENISRRLTAEQSTSAKQKAEQWVREEYKPSDDIKNQIIDFPTQFHPKNSCELSTSGSHICGSNPQINMVKFSTIHKFTSFLLDVDLSPSYELTELKIEIGFDDEHEWLLNVGNSITNDGYSGDYGTQSRDSELQIKGNVLSIFGSDHTPASSSLDGKRLLFTQNNFIENNKRAIFIIRNNYLYWESTKLGKCGYINSPYLFSLDGQDDTEGVSDYSISIGVHRTIANLQRTGVGVRWVRLTLQEANSYTIQEECSSIEIL